jgi:hypothetical protein
MSKDEERKGKRAVAKGLGWRRLEGDDDRHVWDPKDKKKVKSLIPTWTFQAIIIAIFLLSTVAWSYINTQVTPRTQPTAS